MIIGRNPKAPARRSSAKKPAPKKGPSYETKQFNRLSGQVKSDIAKEKKRGTSSAEENRLASQINKDISSEQALTATGMGHPEAKALVAAGIDPKRVEQLTNTHAPEHPAATAAPVPGAGTGFTQTPSSPAQYAADVLKEANLPDTASNEKLLEEQMTVEGMPGSENNPLATSVQMTGSQGINSAGVQEYPSLAEGATAEAATLEQPNMSSIANALKSGTATPQQYAAALAASSYEGYDPAANAAYANSFLTDAGQPEQSFPGGGSSGGGGGSGGASGGGSSGISSNSYGGTTGAAATLADAAASPLFPGLSNLIGTSTSPQTNQSLQAALSSLSANPEAATLSANTANAPGSPDQPASESQKTAVNPAALYQAQLAQLLPGIVPGAAGKQ
jgi:hypothetical protein